MILEVLLKIILRSKKQNLHCEREKKLQRVPTALGTDVFFGIREIYRLSLRDKLTQKPHDLRFS